MPDALPLTTIAMSSAQSEDVRRFSVQGALDVHEVLLHGILQFHVRRAQQSHFALLKASELEVQRVQFVIQNFFFPKKFFFPKVFPP